MQEYLTLHSLLVIRLKLLINLYSNILLTTWPCSLDYQCWIN